MQSDKAASLAAILGAMPSVTIAVSGGVDSLTLAVFAGRQLGRDRVTVMHAVSPAVPPDATARVVHFAELENWRLRQIDAGEFHDENYRRNPVDRCFFCKGNLYGTIAPLAKGTILSGTNTDDLGEYRPGLKAAEAHDVRHPFVEAGLDKQAVRALARLGVVFQQPTMDLDLSVRQNLRFHARMHGMGRMANRRIDEELARIGLLDHGHDPVRKLSGGNRRKVELARALLHRPALLLMDEPTVGLDPASRKALLDYVHQLCSEQGTAVLWATHLVDEAEQAHRVFVLHHGRLIAEQTPEALCQQNGADTMATAFLQLTGTRPVSEEDA